MEVGAQSDPVREPAGPPTRLPALPLRALQVLYAPGELFTKLRERPAWLSALLLGGALVAASFLLVPIEVWEATFRERMINSGRTLPNRPFAIETPFSVSHGSSAKEGSRKLVSGKPI